MADCLDAHEFASKSEPASYVEPTTIVVLGRHQCLGVRFVEHAESFLSFK